MQPASATTGMTAHELASLRISKYLLPGAPAIGHDSRRYESRSRTATGQALACGRADPDLGVSPDARRPAPWDDGRVAARVLIVDDFEAFRRQARALLEAEGFEVVGEAADGASA